MNVKHLLLSFAALAVASLANAQGKGDVIKMSFNGSNETTLNGTALDNYLVFNSAKHNFNAKFKDCSYDGVDYTKGLKMEGATLIQWTQAAVADIEIVQSTWSNNTIKFDDAELDVASASTETAGAYIYKLSNVLPGTHKVTRGSGETGIFAIKITYTTDAMKVLPAVSLDYDKATGIVTIVGSENAAKVVYTIDGKTPTDTSNVYTEPFTVEDGTTVRAMNVGDMTTYVNGPVHDTLVLRDNIKISAPTIGQINGTAVVTVNNTNAKAEYSLDNGATWNAYYTGITFTTDGSIQARATRENCETSDVVSADIKALVTTEGTERIVFQMDQAISEANDGKGDYEIYTADGLNKISMVVDGKNYAKADTLFYNGEAYWSMKCSNGGANKITLAKDLRAVKLTLISYVNGTNGVCGWQEVAGQTKWAMGEDSVTYTAAPTQAFTSPADTTLQYQKWQTEPDVRIFAIDNLQEFTFTNKGIQLCFVAIVDAVKVEVNEEPEAALETINAEAVKAGDIYDLAGRKVAKPLTGKVYIQNGKLITWK